MAITMELYELKNICKEMAALGAATIIQTNTPSNDLVSQREAWRKIAALPFPLTRLPRCKPTRMMKSFPLRNTEWFLPYPARLSPIGAAPPGFLLTPIHFHRQSGKGEVGFRLHWKNGQLFIIQLNGQCFRLHCQAPHINPTRNTRRWTAAAHPRSTIWVTRISSRLSPTLQVGILSTRMPSSVVANTTSW